MLIAIFWIYFRKDNRASESIISLYFWNFQFSFYLFLIVYLWIVNMYSLCKCYKKLFSLILWKFLVITGGVNYVPIPLLTVLLVQILPWDWHIIYPVCHHVIMCQFQRKMFVVRQDSVVRPPSVTDNLKGKVAYHLGLWHVTFQRKIS